MQKLQCIFTQSNVQNKVNFCFLSVFHVPVWLQKAELATFQTVDPKYYNMNTILCTLPMVQLFSADKDHVGNINSLQLSVWDDFIANMPITQQNDSPVKLDLENTTIIIW